MHLDYHTIMFYFTFSVSDVLPGGDEAWVSLQQCVEQVQRLGMFTRVHLHPHGKAVSTSTLCTFKPVTDWYQV